MYRDVTEDALNATGFEGGAFTDQVATRPSAITAADIQNLQDAGIADADIVRLTELNAFLAYQIRLDAGLALMAGASS